MNEQEFLDLLNQISDTMELVKRKLSHFSSLETKILILEEEKNKLGRSTVKSIDFILKRVQDTVYFAKNTPETEYWSSNSEKRLDEIVEASLKLKELIPIKRDVQQ